MSTAYKMVLVEENFEIESRTFDSNRIVFMNNGKIVNYKPNMQLQTNDKMEADDEEKEENEEKKRKDMIEQKEMKALRKAAESVTKGGSVKYFENQLEISELIKLKIRIGTKVVFLKSSKKQFENGLSLIENYGITIVILNEIHPKAKEWKDLTKTNVSRI